MLRLVGTGPAPAGVASRARTRAAPGLRPGPLRPPARSSLTAGRYGLPGVEGLRSPFGARPGAEGKTDGPQKARPGAAKTPDGAPRGATRPKRMRDRRTGCAFWRAVPLPFSGRAKPQTRAPPRRENAELPTNDLRGERRRRVDCFRAAASPRAARQGSDMPTNAPRRPHPGFALGGEHDLPVGPVRQTRPAGARSLQARSARVSATLCAAGAGTGARGVEAMIEGQRFNLSYDEVREDAPEAIAAVEDWMRGSAGNALAPRHERVPISPPTRRPPSSSLSARLWWRIS